MLTKDDKDFLVLIAYGDVGIDETNMERTVNAIKNMIEENDELHDISRNDSGEEIIRDDVSVEDDEEYIK